MLDIDAPEEEPVNYLTLYCVAVYLRGRSPREHRFALPSEAGKFALIQKELGRKFRAFTRYYPKPEVN